MTKILGDIWFTMRGGHIGIVLTEDGLNQEKKAHIGICYGVSKEDDQQHIASWGAKFPLEIAEQLIEGFGFYYK